jgi:hypothetical protein
VALCHKEVFGSRSVTRPSGFGIHADAVVPSAPRYNQRILDAARRLDDRSESIAEICRRVGRYAERSGLPRPSYVHLKRIIKANRRREDELREIAADVVRDLGHGFTVDAYEVADRVREARR